MATSTRRKLGQFFTPSEIVRFMFELVDFQPDWSIVDPACGEGAFLREAIRLGCRAPIGVDLDPRTVARAREISPAATILCGDGLAYQGGSFDLVIGNPPFRNQHRSQVKEELRNGICAAAGLSTRRILPIEALFLLKFITLARAGGHVALILPSGIFASARLRFLREYLVREHTLHAVIELPIDTFRGIRVRACILYLTREAASPEHRVFLATYEPGALERFRRYSGNFALTFCTSS